MSPDARASVVVLASGAGTLLAALIDAASAADYPARVVAVVTDRECRALTVAQNASIPVASCEVSTHSDRASWDSALTSVVARWSPNLVVTAGFMKILGPEFLGRFGGRIVNSHPALLPSFPGPRGVADALAHGVKVTGATVHLVDSGVDTGPILAQAPVMVDADDDESTLHERIKSVERVLLVRVVATIVTRGFVTEGRKARLR